KRYIPDTFFLASAPRCRPIMLTRAENPKQGSPAARILHLCRSRLTGRSVPTIRSTVRAKLTIGWLQSGASDVPLPRADLKSERSTCKELQLQPGPVGVTEQLLAASGRASRR